MPEPHDLYAGVRFSFLLADRYHFTRAWVYPESRVPYSLLRLIESGSGEFDLDGAPHEVREGDVVHIPEGTRLACRATSDEISFVSVRFVSSIKLGDTDFITAYHGVPAVTSFGDDAAIRAAFREIHAAAQGESPARVFRVRGTLELVVARLVERAAERGVSRDRQELLALNRSTTPSRDSALRRDPRIETVVDHLTHHPTERFDMDHLCALADVSPSALRRLFKAHTGKTIGEFVTELRMMTAARMLLITSERIGDVGRRVGYADQNYFTRVFRGVFGVSPHEYRVVSREQQ